MGPQDRGAQEHVLIDNILKPGKVQEKLRMGQRECEKTPLETLAVVWVWESDYGSCVKVLVEGIQRVDTVYI